MARRTFTHCTSQELQHRRTAIYTEIDLLRAEFIAIGREIDKRSQAMDPFQDMPGAKGKSFLVRLASVIWRRHP